MRRDQDQTSQSLTDEAKNGIGRLFARGRLSRRRATAVALISIATGLAIGAVHVSSAIAPLLPEPPLRKTAVLADVPGEFGKPAPTGAYRILNKSQDARSAEMPVDLAARWDTGRFSDDTREGDFAPDIVPTHTVAGKTSNAEGTAEPTTYRTVCVRLCDGFFIPVSFSTTARHIERDVAACQRRCGTGARLFLQENPASGPAKLRDLAGNDYRSLPNAFLFRTRYKSGCTCRTDEDPREDLANSADPRQSRSAGLHLDPTYRPGGSSPAADTPGRINRYPDR